MILLGSQAIRQYLDNPKWGTIRNWTLRLGCPVTLGTPRRPGERSGIPGTQPMADTDELDRWIRLIRMNLRRYMYFRLPGVTQEERHAARSAAHSKPRKKGAVTCKIARDVGQMGYQMALMVLAIPRK